VGEGGGAGGGGRGGKRREDEGKKRERNGGGSGGRGSYKDFLELFFLCFKGVFMFCLFILFPF